MAAMWNSKSPHSRFGGQPYVHTFELEFDDLAVKEFPGINLEWLELVKAKRTLGGIQHTFDVVIGPVANDYTMQTIQRYIDGVYEAEEAMRRLRYARVNDQVSLHTLRAMSLLTSKGYERVA